MAVQTVEQKTILPENQQKFIDDLLADTRTVATQPVDFPDVQIAGLTPLQRAAIQRGAAGIGSFQNLLQSGADAVGMSTVPEVIAARHMSIPCFGFSVITDLGVPGKIVEVTHQEVQQVAAKAEKKLTVIIKQMLASI